MIAQRNVCGGILSTSPSKLRDVCCAPSVGLHNQILRLTPGLSPRRRWYFRDLLFCNDPGYDGGDCCECTCVSTANFSCGKEYHGGYTCVDPNAPCFGDDDDTFTPTSGDDTNTDDASTSCFDKGISDGFCFPDNNNEACGETTSSRAKGDRSCCLYLRASTNILQMGLVTMTNFYLGSKPKFLPL